MEGKLEYETNEDYFVESARLFREQGVRLIGGCCGTTPAHVRATSSALKDLPPITKKVVKMRPAVTVQEREQQDKPHMHEIVKKRRSVIVE